MKYVLLAASLLLLSGCVYGSGKLFAVPAIDFCPSERLSWANTPCIGWRVENQTFSSYPNNYVRTFMLRGAVPIQTLIIVTEDGQTAWADTQER